VDKTGAPTLPNDPVAGLIDIPLPVMVNFWPQTWTSRVAAVLLVLGLIAAIVWIVRRWHADRYRRAALAELDGILHERARKDAAATTDALALLVRRTALTVFGRDTIVPLIGPAWLTFLDHSYGGQEFSQGAGRMLATAPYAQLPVTPSDVMSLEDLVRRWLRTHHA
jgi:Ca-activated chloride channel family protein